MSEAFALPPPGPAIDDEILVVELDGYEGPLDLLLALARRQKVDLRELSMIALVDQYLDYIRAARGRRLTLAADYLVMASWLALLKSRLLLPAPDPALEDEPSPEAVARGLAFRLARLQAMRVAMAALAERPLLGQSVFPRGDPDAIRVVPAAMVAGDLHALVTSYVEQRRRAADRGYRPTRARAYPLEAARERLGRLLPELHRWTALQRVAPAPETLSAENLAAPRASCLASTLSAGLELVRDGALDMRQLRPFDDVWLRRRALAA